MRNRQGRRSEPCRQQYPLKRTSRARRSQKSGPSRGPLATHSRAAREAQPTFRTCNRAGARPTSPANSWWRRRASGDARSRQTSRQPSRPRPASRLRNWLRPWTKRDPGRDRQSCPAFAQLLGWQAAPTYLVAPWTPVVVALGGPLMIGSAFGLIDRKGLLACLASLTGLSAFFLMVYSGDYRHQATWLAFVSARSLAGSVAKLSQPWLNIWPRSPPFIVALAPIKEADNERGQIERETRFGQRAPEARQRRDPGQS